VRSGDHGEKKEYIRMHMRFLDWGVDECTHREWGRPRGLSHLDALDADEVVVPHALVAVGVPEDRVFVPGGVRYRQLRKKK